MTRAGSQLVAAIGRIEFHMFAESPTKFFAKTTDVQLEFQTNSTGKAEGVIWSVGEGANQAKRFDGAKSSSAKATGQNAGTERETK